MQCARSSPAPGRLPQGSNGIIRNARGQLVNQVGGGRCDDNDICPLGKVYVVHHAAWFKGITQHRVA